MAREYGKISSTFWTGETGRAIRSKGTDCQLLALYLLTCPMSNMIGLYYLPLPVIAHETGLTIEGASKGLRSLGEVGFAMWDEQLDHVFIPMMARYQIGEKLSEADKQVKGVIREWRSMSKSRFYKDFHQLYEHAYHLPGLPATGSPLQAPSMGLRSQEQEQEQEQEIEQEQDIPPKVPHGGRPYSRQFLEFWDAYPRKEGKQKAYRYWRTAVKRVRVERSLEWQAAADVILEAARAFAATPLGTGDFCPHPGTWLNGGRWDDDRANWNRIREPIAKQPQAVPQLPE